MLGQYFRRKKWFFTYPLRKSNTAWNQWCGAWGRGSTRGRSACSYSTVSRILCTHLHNDPLTRPKEEDKEKEINVSRSDQIGNRCGKIQVFSMETQDCCGR